MPAPAPPPRPDLVARLPELLAENRLSGWLLFTRESSPDPLAALVGAGQAVARLACLFGRVDGRFHRVAIAASYDVTPLRASGLYDEVLGYGAEGAGPLLGERLGRIDPGAIAVNQSRDISHADGLAAGMRDYLVEVVGAATAARFVSSERLVVDLLSRRSADEIARIEEAVLRSQRVLARAVRREHIAPGKTTENDLAATIRAMVAEGGDAVEFLSINVGQTRGHGEPTDRVIAPGDLLRLDFGIRHYGFCADIQRTAYVLAPGESAAPAGIERLWRVNRRAFAAARAALRPGATGLDVDTAARRVIADAGLDGYPHAAGHPVGERVHDIGPILGPDWPERYGITVRLTIRPGTVFAVEPIVYAPDPRSGETIHIGLEHDLVVTEDGSRLIGDDQEEMWLV
jgi:Xaa-Pro aminopeptidase